MNRLPRKMFHLINQSRTKKGFLTGAETWVRLRYVLTNLIKPSDELAMVSSPSFNSFQSIRSDVRISHFLRESMTQ